MRKENHMKKPIAQQVWELTEPTAASLGYTLWDVEYVKEGADWILRFTIDKPGTLSGEVPGISIDDCETFHRAIDPLLDEADPIEGSYTLEVSSAGADRALKKPEHFRQFMGSEVEIKLYRPRDGRKEHVGVLTNYAEDGTVTIDVAGTPTTFEKKELAQVRLYVRF